MRGSSDTISASDARPAQEESRTAYRRKSNKPVMRASDTRASLHLVRLAAEVRLMKPAVQQAGRAVRESGAVGQHSGPVDQQMGRAAQDMGPADQRMGRAVQRSGRTVQHSGRAVRDVGPVAQGTGRVVQHSGGAVQHSGPTVQHSGPTGNRAQQAVRSGSSTVPRIPLLHSRAGARSRGRGSPVAGGRRGPPFRGEARAAATGRPSRRSCR